MESVMSKEYGTGYKLRVPGYRLAGKTGTAQKTNLKTKKVSGAGYVSNYVGFVPAVNPRVEIMVMIDYPKGEYYGAAVAGPVFQDLAKTMIRYYNLPPDSAVTTEPIAKLPQKPKPTTKPPTKPTTRVPR
jgi:cell division protein FtsI/penicillin-binding protein 2